MLLLPSAPRPRAGFDVPCFGDAAVHDPEDLDPRGLLATGGGPRRGSGGVPRIGSIPAHRVDGRDVLAVGGEDDVLEGDAGEPLPSGPDPLDVLGGCHLL